MEDRIDHAITFGIRLQQYGRCRIAEERAGRTVRIVDDRRHLVGTHDNDPLARSRLDELRTGRQGEEESAARRRDVVGEGILAACLVGDQVARRREEHVGSNRRTDHHVDRHRIDARLVEQVRDRTGSHIGGTDTLAFEDVACLDTGMRHDPLVIGVDHPAQFVVGENIIGEVLSYARNRSCYLTH